MMWRGVRLVECFRHELNYEIVHAMPLHLCLSIKKLARLSLMGLNENGRGVDKDFDGIASLFNTQTIPYRVFGSVCFLPQIQLRGWPVT